MRVLISNPAHAMPSLLDAVICRCAGMERKAGERLPPIGLAYIASVLKQGGHEVTLIDCATEGMPPERFKKTVERHNPELFISITSERTESFDMGYFELAAAYGSTTAACGGYPTIRAGELLKNRRCLDIVIMGEPEATALELAAALSEDRGLEGVLGIAYRDKNRIRTTGRRELIADLEKLPMPARECLKNEKYTSPYSERGAQTVVISSRGCPHSCNFCTKDAYYGNTYRYRSAQHTVDEMEETYRRYGITDFSFQDDNFTQNGKRVVQICEEMERRGLDLAWQCTSRVDCVNKEMLSRMKRAGCYLIKYGIESGDERTLERMGKGITPAQSEKAVKETKRAGMLAGGSFILGTPWDGADTTANTIRFASRLPLDYASFNTFEGLGKNDAPGPGMRTKAGLWAAYCGFYLAPQRLRTHMKEPAKSARAARSILRYLIRKCYTQ